MHGRALRQSDPFMTLANNLHEYFAISMNLHFFGSIFAKNSKICIGVGLHNDPLFSIYI